LNAGKDCDCDCTHQTDTRDDGAHMAEDGVRLAEFNASFRL
jgi:hypothetical protein